MFEDDMEYVKPSRTRKRSAVLKAVRDPMFKMQTIENKKKVSQERFVDDYHDDYEEYLGEIDDSLDGDESNYLEVGNE